MQHNLESLLEQLIDDWENELVEFKQVNDSYSTSEIGKYFSALANEANLRHVEKAWLIFGVDNRSRKVVGSTYRQEKESLNNLKYQISTSMKKKGIIQNIGSRKSPIWELQDKSRTKKNKSRIKFNKRYLNQ